LSARTAQEEVGNILKKTTKGAGTIIICATRVKASICVDFAVMDQPKEGFAAGRSCIVPDVDREDIIWEVRVS